MPAGRPIKSEVRQNVVNILFLKSPLCGYEIYKIYQRVFGKAPLRLIYYHLKKGVEINEFEIQEIIKTRGDYSWGGEAEKIYYKLGIAAKPLADEKINKIINKQK